MAVTAIRHFTDLSAVPATDLRAMLDDAAARKARLKAGERSQAARRQGAGDDLRQAVDAHPRLLRRRHAPARRRDDHADRAPRCSSAARETIADTAKVLSRYVDAIMIRTTDHDRLLELTEHATVPVINGLTDDTHPCQIMADVMTFEEHRGPVAGQTFAWTGDGNNVLHSLLEASARFGFNVQHRRAAKAASRASAIVDWARANGGAVTLDAVDAEEAVHGADCVVTDSWVSMNQEHRARGHNVFLPYQVNAALMAKAKPGRAVHALPAGASRRGSHRRGDRRAALGGVRRGREPAACAEGGSRLVPRRLNRADRDAYLTRIPQQPAA